MSAVVGLIRFDGQEVSTYDIQQAMDNLAIYGGDGARTWAGDSVVFGHQMLYTTPESMTEIVPLAVDNLIITADARLDNREELQRLLSIPDGAQPSDSLLILRAYQKWKTDCVPYLLGDFVFALWDSNDKRLFCARDHIGTRPFYYYCSDRIFAFASDLQALQTIPGVSQTINEQEIARLLQYKGPFYFLTQRTFYKDIYRLPFANYMVVQDGKLHRTQYWHPEKLTPLRLPSEEDYVATLIELLHKAVECRLRTPLNVGAHLSGGIDSSSIALLAGRKLRAQGKKLSLYSWSSAPQPTETEQYEYRRLLKLCQQEGFDPQFVEKAQVKQSIETYYQTNLAARSFNTLFYELEIQKRAEKDNIRVMLSGWGGDEAISYNGRDQYQRQFWQGRWWSLINNLKGPRRSFRNRRVPKIIGRAFWKHVLLPQLPSRIQSRFAFKSRQDLLRRFIHRDFRPRVDQIVDRYRPKIVNTQIELFYNGHLTDRMESWAWFGAQTNFVYAYPLLDRRILEFAYRIPHDLYLKEGWSRYLYRKAMDAYFPEGYVWNRHGALKAEATLFQAIGYVISEDLTYAKRFLKANPDNPWIDVPELSATLERINLDEIVPADYLAIRRALDCIQIWAYNRHKIAQP